MSLPAREAERWAQPGPQSLPGLRDPADLPARRPPAARPPIPNPPLPRRRARRGPHAAFWILSLVVVSSMAFGLVSLNAMRVDAAYETRSVIEELRLLRDEHGTLVNDVARLSSPSRIGTWALARGLVHPAPGEVVILQVPGRPPAPHDRGAGAGG